MFVVKMPPARHGLTQHLKDNKTCLSFQHCKGRDIIKKFQTRYTSIEIIFSRYFHHSKAGTEWSIGRNHWAYVKPQFVIRVRTHATGRLCWCAENQCMSIVSISLRANKYCQQYTMPPPPNPFWYVCARTRWIVTRERKKIYLLSAVW